MVVHLGLADAACGWQMAKEKYDRPDLFVAENALRGRHARGRDSVVDHPLQLPVGVTLYLHRGQRRKRGGHAVGKGHSAALSVESMARDAIVTERFLAVCEVFRRERQRILHGFIA